MHALIWIAAGLVVVWLVVWLGFHLAGFLVHLLLVAAVLALIGWLIARSTGTPTA